MTPKEAIEKIKQHKNLAITLTLFFLLFISWLTTR